MSETDLKERKTHAAAPDTAMRDELMQLLADVENERIDKSEWLPRDEVIQEVRLNRDIVKETTPKGGLQYRGFSNLLDFYLRRQHISRAQHRAGSMFYRLWYGTILRDRYVRCRYGEMKIAIDFDTLAIIPHEFLLAKMAIESNRRIITFDACCYDIPPGRRKLGLLLAGLDDLMKHFEKNI